MNPLQTRRPNAAAIGPAIVYADPSDAHHLADLIATAFHDLEPAKWLVPEPSHRHRVLHANFELVVEHALQHGVVLTDEDRTAAAVWFPRETPLPEIPHYERRLSRACGRYTDRFTIMDAAFDRHHPAQPHHHLAFLAVHPDQQGHGLGTALLKAHHDRLDSVGLPAYLEASSQSNRVLYLRRGYTDHGEPIELADGGPWLWPMWRTPRLTG
ncbi:GNAT family N-acetyltransferase [Dactylosporangium sp. NPDC049525]|uniref:GNAT family N-acetyltransferase n=1 Tax=Dactylosporangium sp. NPDC049525 TaxID=3154730 RepID=UPI00341A2AC6